MIRRLRSIAPLALAAFVACGSEPSALKSPVSDSQVDDGDQPAAPGVVTIPIARREAGAGCTLDRECPSSARCFFPVRDGCAAIGRCFKFATPAGCAHAPRCSCAGRVVDECVPDGFSVAPLAAGTACAPSDAGAD